MDQKSTDPIMEDIRHSDEGRNTLKEYVKNGIREEYEKDEFSNM
jgi:hypothetical protein